MSGFSALEIGKRALIAQRMGIDITGNNIANVNTPGYARQEVLLGESTPQYLVDKGFIGTGVSVDAIKSFRDEYFDREIRNNLSRKTGYEADDKTLQRIETILKEPSENGLNSVMTKFFNSFQDLSIEPESVARRELVLNSAQDLVNEFHTNATSLQDLRSETYTKLDNQISDVNRILKQIAELNTQINASAAKTLDTSNTLRDQRSQLIEDLSKYGGTVFVSIDNRGMANVNIGGNTVVTAGAASTLKLKETQSPNGERTIKIDIVNRIDTSLATLNPDSGEFASALKTYNITLDEKDTSGGFSVAKTLGDIATNIVNKVNAASVNGFGLDDTTAPNRTFFTPLSPGTSDAFAISIDPSVLNQPRKIPIAATAGNPGDNTIARVIAGIANDTTFLNSQTPVEYYSAFLNKLASNGSDAKSGMKTTGLLGDQLNSQRESVIGVNLDEEAINLVKYQKGYEAAARVINTSSEMLTTLINLGR